MTHEEKEKRLAMALKEFSRNNRSLEGNATPFLYALYLDYASSFHPEGEKKLSNIADEEIRSLGLDPDEIVSLCKELSLEKREYPHVISLIVSYFDKKEALDNPLNRLIVCLLDVHDGDRLFDPVLRKGRFIRYASNRCREFGASLIYTGREIREKQAHLVSMIMEMQGETAYIENADFLSDSSFPKFDKAFIFPPEYAYLSPRQTEKLIKEYDGLIDGNTSPVYFFLLKAMKCEGWEKIVVLLPSEPLSRSRDIGVRKYLVESRLIEGIVHLPPSYAYHSRHGLNLLVISNEKHDHFQYVDAQEILERWKEEMGEEEFSLSMGGECFEMYRARDVSHPYEDIDKGNYGLSRSDFLKSRMYEGMKEVVPLKEVAEVFAGSPMTIKDFKEEPLSYKKPVEKALYHVLTSASIDEEGHIDYGSIESYYVPTKKIESLKAKEGDLVMTSKSSKVKLALIEEDFGDNLVTAGGMNIIRCDKAKVDPLYLKMLFSSKQGEKLLSLIKRGNLVTSISFKELRELKIPCPPLERQKEAAERYAALLRELEEKKKEMEELKKRVSSVYEEEFPER